jgi:hypothetical protein
MLIVREQLLYLIVPSFFLDVNLERIFLNSLFLDIHISFLIFLTSTLDEKTQYILLKAYIINIITSFT